MHVEVHTRQNHQGKLPNVFMHSDTRTYKQCKICRCIPSQHLALRPFPCGVCSKVATITNGWSLRDFSGIFACFSIFTYHVYLKHWQPFSNTYHSFLDFLKGPSLLPALLLNRAFFFYKLIVLNLDHNVEHLQCNSFHLSELLLFDYAVTTALHRQN